ncbi:hypothetical protein DRH14_03590 [Candidatus Shapirobacteria bacterium]|nr:MAG: hypothetical protein DRH14_03590 [Candidatus Shapirobacteria bacterium]
MQNDTIVDSTNLYVDSRNLIWRLDMSEQQLWYLWKTTGNYDFFTEWYELRVKSMKGASDERSK